MSKVHVVTKTIDSRTIRELIKNYVLSLGHKTNRHCRSVELKGNDNCIIAEVDVEDPQNPVKGVKKISKDEAERIIAKVLHIDLNTTELDIDRY